MSTETTNTNNGPASIDYVAFATPAAGPWIDASEVPKDSGPFLVMATNSWGETWAWTALWESQRWRADDEDHTPLLKVTHYAIIKPPKP